MSKELIVLGGPNGAGKSTLATEYILNTRYAFLSADAIAARLSPANPAAAKIAAGRAFIERVNQALAGKNGFIIETTLSGRTAERTLRAARKAGFVIAITYVFLDSVETCIQRVHERVGKGGHLVSDADIRRRFSRSLRNFWHIYRPLADCWYLVYNSAQDPHIVADGYALDVAIRDSEVFDRFQKLLEAQRHD
ncbi:MAG: AAA family ATPase [Planctomycetaceae bacterium]